jgi:hypothetical protein
MVSPLFIFRRLEMNVYFYTQIKKEVIMMPILLYSNHKKKPGSPSLKL